MVKTTPPGRGSRLLRPGGPDPVHALASTAPCGALLLATGPFEDDDLGVSCYHAKTGAVELYLNHLVDGPGEYVVVDCTAGADSFASGLFTRFDLTVLVAEPTRKGISVYRQWQGYADGFDVAVALVGNKVQTREDVAFLRSQRGEEPLTWFGHEPAVRAMEQGRPFSLDDLSPDTAAALVGLLGPGWTRGPRTGQVRAPGGRVPPEERPGLGQRRGRPGPHRPDRPRLHPRPARAGPRCGRHRLPMTISGSSKRDPRSYLATPAAQRARDAATACVPAITAAPRRRPAPGPGSHPARLTTRARYWAIVVSSAPAPSNCVATVTSVRLAVDHVNSRLVHPMPA